MNVTTVAGLLTGWIRAPGNGWLAVVDAVVPIECRPATTSRVIAPRVRGHPGLVPGPQAHGPVPELTTDAGRWTGATVDARRRNSFAHSRLLRCRRLTERRDVRHPMPGCGVNRRGASFAVSRKTMLVAEYRSYTGSGSS